MSRFFSRMITLPSLVRIALALSAVVAVAAAPAADQALLGKSLKIVDPKPTDATKRKVTANASDPGPGHTVSGDPVGPESSSGAVVVLAAEGATPSTQTFTLPQGTAANGRPFWRAIEPRRMELQRSQGRAGPVQVAAAPPSPTTAS